MSFYWIRIRIPNKDPDPGEPNELRIRIHTNDVNHLKLKGRILI